MTHERQHPQSRKKVILGNVASDPREMITNGKEFIVEDWVDRLGASWRLKENWATEHYARRQQESLLNNGRALPDDDEVVYGHIGSLGHCVHQSELDYPSDASPSEPKAG